MGTTEQRLAALDQKPDGGTLFVVDCDIDERGRADDVDAFFAEVAPCDRDRLDRLVRRTGADRLNLGHATVADDPGDSPCYRAWPRAG